MDLELVAGTGWFFLRALSYFFFGAQGVLFGECGEGILDSQRVRASLHRSAILCDVAPKLFALERLKWLPPVYERPWETLAHRTHAC